MTTMKERIDELRGRIQAMPERDQRALKWLSIFLIPAIVYLVLIYPVQTQRTKWRSQVAEAQDQLNYIQTNAGIVRSLRNAGVGSERNGRNLTQVVTDSAQQHGLTVANMRPHKERDLDVLDVTLNDSAFDEVLPWLYDFETRYSVRIVNANLTPGDGAGTVRVSLKLKDGGA